MSIFKVPSPPGFYIVYKNTRDVAVAMHFKTRELADKYLASMGHGLVDAYDPERYDFRDIMEVVEL